MNNNQTEQTGAVIGAVRRANGFTRTVSAVVIVAFAGLVTTPTVMAARQKQTLDERHAIPAPTQSEIMVNALANARHALANMLAEPTALRTENTARNNQLANIIKALRVQNEQAMQGFARVAGHLKKTNAAPVILQRHEAVVEKYRQKMGSLLGHLQAAATGDTQSLRQSHASNALDILTRKTAQHVPEKLPFRTADNKVREPFIKPEKLHDFLNVTDTKTLSVNQANNTTLVQKAGQAIDPAYLAETPATKITPEIQALADQLNNNPVKIYNWVHNNIVYMPTYGSMQGAAQTLATGRGNAFDTASLLVALLRASDIPARYVYGTVEIPVGKVMNWVGGVTVPMAAGNLMGQGGIPNVALTLGGEVKAFRLEHVWVEARVDYYPSRAAVNRQADAWIPMDASFKQYTYTEGVDVSQEIPFDAQTFIAQVRENATVNEAEGWVQGVDKAYIQSRLQEYRADVEAFVESQAPDTTVGDVLGTKTIDERHKPTLAASLPFNVVAVGDRYSEIPDNLQYKFKYGLYNQYGQPLASYQAKTVELAGKRFAVSFRPATQADADTIISYLPEPPADGSDPDPSQLPDSLPGYLIDLTAEITINGEVVKTGPTATMGTEIQVKLGYYFPGQGWKLRPKSIVAGEYQAVGLDMAGIAPARFQALKADLQRVKAKLEAQNTQGLTRHSLTGNILQSGVLSYFAINDLQDKVSAKSAGIVINRLPSFGSLSTNVQTHYWFGIPRDVSFPSVSMDIDFIYSQVVDKDNKQKDVIGFMRATGPRTSALEHTVPEKMFSSATNVAHGVSAAKALAIAQAEGQRVYTITTENLNTALAAVNAGNVIESEIRTAVGSGKQVTIHQNSISFYGWQGYGYIVLDPKTGAGAYKISGGTNGGETAVDNGTLLSILGGVLEFGKAASKYKGLFKWMGVVGTIVGVALDFLKLLEACGWGAAIGLTIANLIISALIMFYFTAILSIFILPIIVIAFVLAIAAIIAAFVTGLIVNAAASSCRK